MALIITHNSGFFSCCAVKLTDIVNYINHNKNLPEKVDSSKQFEMYKPNLNKDITYDFFEFPNSSEYIYTNYINYHWEHQFIEYSKLHFEGIVPIVKKYFEPSHNIKALMNKIIDTYNICYEKCIAVYYRGTDKHSETKIDSFESFNNKLNELLTTINGDNFQILLQSDSAPFLDYITTKNTNKNLIVLKELAPSYTFVGTHNERSSQQNYNDILNLLSIVLIISKCKYIICTSGNVSEWIMFYRGNTDNVHQNLNYNWT